MGSHPRLPGNSPKRGTNSPYWGSSSACVSLLALKLGSFEAILCFFTFSVHFLPFLPGCILGISSRMVNDGQDHGQGQRLLPAKAACQGPTPTPPWQQQGQWVRVVEGGEHMLHGHQACPSSASQGCGCWPRSEKKGVPVARPVGRGWGLSLLWEQWVEERGQHGNSQFWAASREGVLPWVAPALGMPACTAPRSAIRGTLGTSLSSSARPGTVVAKAKEM